MKNKKISYQSDWIPLSDAINLFNEQAELFLALRDNKVKSTGRSMDEISAHHTGARLDIPHQDWESYRFIPEEMTLEFEDTEGNYLRWWTNIEISRNDLSSLESLSKENTSNKKSGGAPRLIDQNVLYAEICAYIYSERNIDIPLSSNVAEKKKFREWLYRKIPSIINLNESASGDIDKTVRRYTEKFLSDFKTALKNIDDLES